MSPGAPAARPRVGFELTGLEVDRAGSARAVVQLRDALRAREDVELVEVAQPPARGPLARRVARGLARELTWFPARLQRRARRLRLDLLHCPMPLAPVRAGVPLVLTLADALAWEHPEWFGRELVAQHRLVVGPAARRAARVLTPSRWSAERLAGEVGVDPARIEVTPWAADPRFAPSEPDESRLEALGVRRPYALAVGTMQPRKNLEAVLDAFDRLAAAGAEHRLVVAGARGWRDAELAARLDRSPGGRARALGRVSDADLLDLYRGADCLVFCSRAEGFGLPALEAMACGTPVVCSSTTGLGEVAGDAAELADPADVASIERALARVLGSGERRDDLRRLGLARAAEFTWERCAELTAAAYRRALA